VGGPDAVTGLMQELTDDLRHVLAMVGATSLGDLDVSMATRLTP
jgi:hypothetical protein